MNQNLTTEKHNVEFKESWRDEYPVAYTALREVILNAVIHKDYAVPYPTQISVYNDKLMIWNAGVLPEDWTTETLLGKHTSEPYNPLVAKVFYRAGDIETWGRGMEKVIDACKENDFPSPTAYTQGSGLWVVFNYSDDYVNKLSAIDRGEKIWFDPENGMGSGTVNGSLNNENKGILSGTETVNGSLNGSLNKRQLNIVEMIGDYGAINAIELAERQKSSLRTMYRSLSFLSSIDLGLVTREGSKKTGNYVLTDKGRTFYKDILKKG